VEAARLLKIEVDLLKQQAKDNAVKQAEMDEEQRKQRAATRALQEQLDLLSARVQWEAPPPSATFFETVSQSIRVFFA